MNRNDNTSVIYMLSNQSSSFGDSASSVGAFCLIADSVLNAKIYLNINNYKSTCYIVILVIINVSCEYVQNSTGCITEWAN